MNPHTGVKKRIVVRELRAAGFRKARSKGGHEIWKHPGDGQSTTTLVSGSGGKEVDPAQVRDIRQAIADAPQPAVAPQSSASPPRPRRAAAAVPSNVRGTRKAAAVLGVTAHDTAQAVTWCSGNAPKLSPHRSEGVCVWATEAALHRWWSAFKGARAGYAEAEAGQGPVYGGLQLSRVVGTNKSAAYRLLKRMTLMSPDDLPARGVNPRTDCETWVWPTEDKAEEWYILALDKVKPPAVVVHGRVRFRTSRGPDLGGRWYWRGIVYGNRTEKTVWSGWATRDGVVEASGLDGALVGIDVGIDVGIEAPKAKAPEPPEPRRSFAPLADPGDLAKLLSALDTPAVRILGVVIDEQAILRRAVAIGIASMLAELS